MSDEPKWMCTTPMTDEVVYAVLDMLYDLITDLENEHFSRLRRHHNKLHRNQAINNDQPWL